MHKALLGLGSNLGNRAEFLNKAVQLLQGNPHLRVDAVSKFYETQPETPEVQPHYLNAAASISTELSVQELLVLSQSIETQLERSQKGQIKPRTIDIDILFYDNDIVSQDELVVPHPLIQNRLFVLKPLCDIAPDWIHPVFQKSIQSLFTQFPLELVIESEKHLSIVVGWLAAELKPGDRLMLEGEIGAGKTTLVRYLAEAIGCI